MRGRSFVLTIRLRARHALIFLYFNSLRTPYMISGCSLLYFYTPKSYMKATLINLCQSYFCKLGIIPYYHDPSLVSYIIYCRKQQFYYTFPLFFGLISITQHELYLLIDLRVTLALLTAGTNQRGEFLEILHCDWLPPKGRHARRRGLSVNIESEMFTHFLILILHTTHTKIIKNNKQMNVQ